MEHPETSRNELKSPTFTMKLPKNTHYFLKLSYKQSNKFSQEDYKSHATY